MHARLAVLDALQVLRDAPARVVAENRASWRLDALPVVAERQERGVLAEQRPVEIAEEEDRAAACRLLLQAARMRVGCERRCGAEGYRTAEGTQHEHSVLAERELRQHGAPCLAEDGARPRAAAKLQACGVKYRAACIFFLSDI